MTARNRHRLIGLLVICGAAGFIAALAVWCVGMADMWVLG